MSTQQRDNSGILSRNEDKQKPDGNPNWPDYKGSAKIAGKEYWLAGWIKDGRDGKKFLSLAIKSKEAAPAEDAASATPAANDADDNLPF